MPSKRMFCWSRQWALCNTHIPCVCVCAQAGSRDHMRLYVVSSSLRARKR